MKFFIDTADLKEIRDAAAMGVIDGVTTNPSLVAKSGRKYLDVVREICEVVDGPIFAEVLSTDYEGMIFEAHDWAKVHKNVVVKLPFTLDGLRATKTCSAEGIKTNVTLCFSPLQALIAAKAGATYISPFVGRLDDIGHDGMLLVEQIVQVYRNYSLPTQVLVASVRSPVHVLEGLRLGAHVATIPFDVIGKLLQHPLTDLGLQRFLADAAKIPKD